MTIQVWIDGWPYQVEFTGTIDIARLESGDVALRRVSDDATLTVRPDDEEMVRSKEAMTVMHERKREFDRFLDQLWRDPWQSIRSRSTE